MPLLSAFTPCGMLDMSADPSHGETVYRSMLRSYGDGNYKLDVGSYVEASTYARAMQIAEARYALEHAGYQNSPPYVDEMMADRESEWGIVPGPSDSLPTRRAVLGAREILPRGARREAVVDALTTLLGSNFVALRTIKPAERVIWPATLGDPAQNLQIPTVPRKMGRLPQGVSTGLGGVPQLVNYTPLDANQPALLTGDQLLVEPEIPARAEVVTITMFLGFFQAAFNHAHDANCLVTTQPYPLWVSTQRTWIIIVSAIAGVDPETRRKVNDLVQRMARAVTVWAIVQQTAPGQAGPFKLTFSPLNATPLGVVTYP